MKIKELLPGISISILISLIAWYLGNLFPIIGGPVIGLFIGLLLASLLINQERFIIGMQFSGFFKFCLVKSKKIEKPTRCRRVQSEV